MNNDVLATKNFIIKREGEEYHYTLHLVPHGGFDYGNGHALVLDRHAYTGEECFDARYDPRFANADSFNENAYDFIRNIVDPTFTVEEVKE